MMKPLSLIFIVFSVGVAQGPTPPGPPPEPGEMGPQLPNGRSQRNAIAKDDYKRNVEDAAALARLAEDLKADLEKDEAFIVSVKVMKRTEDIEKLAKGIRARLKRY